jgi:hypothetical protein
MSESNPPDCTYDLYSQSMKNDPYPVFDRSGARSSAGQRRTQLWADSRSRRATASDSAPPRFPCFGSQVLNSRLGTISTPGRCRNTAISGRSSA